MTAVIGACQGCGACLLTCPERAIRPVRDRLTVNTTSDAIPGAGPARLLVLDTCTGCGECVEICPVDAISLTANPLGSREEPR